MSKLMCTCGLEIPDENITYYNRGGSSWEDDENYEVTAECECGKEYTSEEWGDCDGKEQAKEVLSDNHDLKLVTNVEDE